MTQAEMPNPIELYERAVSTMRPIIAGIKPEQLNAATPCTEWNVQQLLLHNLNVARMLEGILTGSLTPDALPNPMDVSGPLPPEGAAAAYETSTANLLNAVRAPGMVDQVFDTPFGPASAGSLLNGIFGDVLIHQWDLAKATNQDFTMDDALAEVCRQVMEPHLEQGRAAGFIGPVIAVPDDASPGDKLLGLAGRQP